MVPNRYASLSLNEDLLDYCCSGVLVCHYPMLFTWIHEICTRVNVDYESYLFMLVVSSEIHDTFLPVKSRSLSLVWRLIWAEGITDNMEYGLPALYWLHRY